MPKSDFSVTELYSISLPAQSPALWPVLRMWKERIFTAFLATQKKQVSKQNSEPGSSSSIIINLGKSTYHIVHQFPQQYNVDDNSSFNNFLELLGFPCGSASKESACNAGDLGLIPWMGQSPGEGQGYPLQYSGLENSIDWIVIWARKELDMTERLSLSFSPKILRNFSGGPMVDLALPRRRLGFDPWLGN